MRATIQNIAEKANVSSATVSRVINRRPDTYISAATRERVLAVAAELGYRPNGAARALVTGRTQMIGIWAPQIEDAYFARTLAQAESLLEQQGYGMILSKMIHSMDSPLSISQGVIDGVIALEDPLYVETYLTTHPSHLPLVSMGAYVSRKTDYVEVDYEIGSCEAVRHLIASGCKRILFVVSTWGNHLGDARYRAYTQTMKKAGLSTEYLVTQKPDREEGRASLSAYVAQHGCPDGIFFFNDYLAIGGYRGLCDLGIRIPDQVLLVGCDGIEDTQYLDSPLSTVVSPVAPLCHRALQFLQQRLAAPSANVQQEALPTHLVIRESSQR